MHIFQRTFEWKLPLIKYFPANLANTNIWCALHIKGSFGFITVLAEIACMSFLLALTAMLCVLFYVLHIAKLSLAKFTFKFSPTVILTTVNLFFQKSVSIINCTLVFFFTPKWAFLWCSFKLYMIIMGQQQIKFMLNRWYYVFSTQHNQVFHFFLRKRCPVCLERDNSFGFGWSCVSSFWKRSNYIAGLLKSVLYSKSLFRFSEIWIHLIWVQ